MKEGREGKFERVKEKMRGECYGGDERKVEDDWKVERML